MTEQECLARMVAPATHRPGKYGSRTGFGGVIQIMVTRACDQSCFGCTQGSNLAGPTHVMTPEQFRDAVLSLKGYPGIVGVFGGNPAMSPHFEAYCAVLHDLVPFERRGLWCNHPRGKAKVMRVTFNPAVSNLNVHLDQEAWDQFKRDWPESQPFGLHDDSRHSPPFVAMKDVVRKQCHTCSGTGQIGYAGPTCHVCDGNTTVRDESRIWEMISTCDINRHWSAMIGVFRGELRAWFCEVAGAQAMLHQAEEDYPDTGMVIRIGDNHKYAFEEVEYDNWWQLPMKAFTDQVRKHCFDCGVPLRGYGELAQGDVVRGPKPSLCNCGADRSGPSAEAHADSCPENHREQTSATHAGIYRPKRPGRRVEVVTELVQLNVGRIEKSTHYLQNARV